MKHIHTAAIGKYNHHIDARMWDTLDVQCSQLEELSLTILQCNLLRLVSPANCHESQHSVRPAELRQLPHPCSKHLRPELWYAAQCGVVFNGPELCF